MQGIHSFMGWSHIPDVDSEATTTEDNPFAGSKVTAPGKVLVQMLTEDWLYQMLSKLNLTLVEGYSSRGSEACGLTKDVFSIVLYKSCYKCQKCCTKSACRGQTSKLLANLAEPGCRSESSSNPERGLHPALSDPTTI